MTDVQRVSASLRDEETGLEATFVPGAGMLCCSLRHRGEELLAQNAGVAAYAEQGKTMGIPLLYPWANRLAAFDYSVAGRKVLVPHDPARIALDDNGLPIHGVIGGRQAWELVDTPGPDARSLGGTVELERVGAGAVRGVSVPPRPPLRGAPDRRTARDRGDRARLRRGRRAAGVRLSSLPLAAGRTARAVADRAAGDAPPGARRQPDSGRPRAGAAAPSTSRSPSASSTMASTRSPSPPASP